ncbi:MAG: N-acetyl sugar amidotransferase [Coxiella sp. RIFCSPHIGHO2_12_FULL_44_14]|nr:MAG: N-acetyl sugar amidotransferase [Coxiella sp. RIFCSPHIGHO2_12_FULL_44_14]
MEYCTRCVYPANTRPGIVFDAQGVCSGCRLIESRPTVDWINREQLLRELLAEYQAKQRDKGNPYDCIIPVSGGKDSTYQTYLMKQRYGMNPLLVTYNHTFNTPLGIRNLTNLIEKMDCNLLRFTTAPGAANRLSRYMLEKVGDVTWHYHAGIMTFPIRVAVMYNVPLIVWGEEGFSELMGMHNQDDFVEFTKKKRQEHSMRGFEPEDILEDPYCPLTRYDLEPFFYPDDEVLERLGVRGIYLSNYIPWHARRQTEFIIKELDFETAQVRDRTFNLYDKLEDVHANGLHDYLKFLKFGYGRATDDASTEIRHGYMTREQGIEMVMKYDAVRPRDMDIFLKVQCMTKEALLAIIEPLRDPRIWQKEENNTWRLQDCVGNHKHDSRVDLVRLPLRKDISPFIRSPEKMSDRTVACCEQQDYVLL